LSKGDDQHYIGHIFVLRAIKVIGHDMLYFKLMTKQLALAAILSLSISSARPVLVAPLTPACACVAASSFGCEISLRDMLGTIIRGTLI